VVAVFFLKLISRSLPQGFAQEKGLIFAEERPKVSLSIPRGVNLFGTRVLVYNALGNNFPFLILILDPLFFSIATIAILYNNNLYF